MDECQISSSEYLENYTYKKDRVLDECQISSSEYICIVMQVECFRSWMSVRSVVPSTARSKGLRGIVSWMSVRSVVPSTPVLSGLTSISVLDECQISSSEY